MTGAAHADERRRMAVAIDAIEQREKRRREMGLAADIAGRRRDPTNYSSRHASPLRPSKVRPGTAGAGRPNGLWSWRARSRRWSGLSSGHPRRLICRKGIPESYGTGGSYVRRIFGRDFACHDPVAVLINRGRRAFLHPLLADAGLPHLAVLKRNRRNTHTVVQVQKDGS